jgi:hypothetical protein
MRVSPKEKVLDNEASLKGFDAESAWLFETILIVWVWLWVLPQASEANQVRLITLSAPHVAVGVVVVSLKAKDTGAVPQVS